MANSLLTATPHVKPSTMTERRTSIAKPASPKGKCRPGVGAGQRTSTEQHLTKLMVLASFSTCFLVSLLNQKQHYCLIMEKFGTHLKKIRQSKGWTQEELGIKMGVHANHISRYEQNKSLPNTETLKQFAEVLEVSLDELVFGRTFTLADKITDEQLLNLFEKASQLSDEERSTIKSLIDAFIFRAETQSRLAS